MKITDVLILSALGACLMNCENDKETPVNSEYVVLYGALSAEAALYLVPENLVHHKEILNIQEWEGYYDGVISGDKLFTISTDAKIRRSDVNSFAPEAETPLFQEVQKYIARKSPLMRMYEESVLAAGTFEHLGERHLYLKFYDESLGLEDSLVIQNIDVLYDIRVEGSRIYLSISQGETFSLMVLNSKNETPATINLNGKRCSELILAGDTLLAALPDDILVLDKISLNELTTLPVMARQDSISPLDYFAYEKVRHLLHFFSPASDNGPDYTHYTISSLVLKSGDVLPLAPEEYFISPPIVYNPRLKILTAIYLSNVTNFEMDGSETRSDLAYDQLEKILLSKE